MKLSINKHNSTFHRSLAGAYGVLLILCAGPVGLAQQNGSANGVKPQIPVQTPATRQAGTEVNETPTPDREGRDGIKVHGHWKFVVHNPDGTLVSTHEFENSLITPAAGDFLIASALVGQSVPVDWAVMLCPVAGTNWAFPPYTSGRMLQGTYCPGIIDPVAILVPSFTTVAGSIVSYGSFCNPINPSVCITGLTQALTGGTTSSPGYSITLNGNFTASVAVTINSVGTYTGYCPPVGAGLFNTNSPATCETTLAPRFNTTATTPTMLPFTGTNQTQVLTAGQILTVTVTISFS